MANPSMDREPVAWLRELLEQAHPALLREILAAITLQLMTGEAKRRAVLSAANAVLTVLPPARLGHPRRLQLAGRAQSAGRSVRFRTAALAGAGHGWVGVESTELVPKAAAAEGYSVKHIHISRIANRQIAKLLGSHILRRAGYTE